MPFVRSRSPSKFEGLLAGLNRRERSALELGGCTAFRTHSNSNMLTRPAWVVCLQAVQRAEEDKRKAHKAAVDIQKVERGKQQRSRK